VRTSDVDDTPAVTGTHHPTGRISALAAVTRGG
jgi:hypothetical protein